MKKGFIAFVKALFGVVKVVLAILGVLVLAAVASALLSIPGGKRSWFFAVVSYYICDTSSSLLASKDFCGSVVSMVVYPCRSCIDGFLFAL